MPNIIGTSLKTSEPVELVDLLKGHISLVAISGTRFGEEHINTFMTPFLEKWTANSKDSKVQLIEPNIQENPLKAGLVRMMVPFVKKTIPEERQVSWKTGTFFFCAVLSLNLTNPCFFHRSCRKTICFITSRSSI